MTILTEERIINLDSVHYCDASGFGDVTLNDIPKGITIIDLCGTSITCNFFS